MKSMLATPLEKLNSAIDRMDWIEWDARATELVAGKVAGIDDVVAISATLYLESIGFNYPAVILHVLERRLRSAEGHG